MSGDYYLPKIALFSRVINFQDENVCGSESTVAITTSFLRQASSFSFAGVRDKSHARESCQGHPSKSAIRLA